MIKVENAIKKISSQETENVGMTVSPATGLLVVRVSKCTAADGEFSCEERGRIVRIFPKFYSHIN